LSAECSDEASEDSVMKDGHFLGEAECSGISEEEFSSSLGEATLQLFLKLKADHVEAVIDGLPSSHAHRAVLFKPILARQQADEVLNPIKWKDVGRFLVDRDDTLELLLQGRASELVRLSAALELLLQGKASELARLESDCMPGLSLLQCILMDTFFEKEYIVPTLIFALVRSGADLDFSPETYRITPVINSSPWLADVFAAAHYFGRGADVSKPSSLAALAWSLLNKHSLRNWKVDPFTAIDRLSTFGVTVSAYLPEVLAEVDNFPVEWEFVLETSREQVKSLLQRWCRSESLWATRVSRCFKPLLLPFAIDLVIEFNLGKNLRLQPLPPKPLFPPPV